MADIVSPEVRSRMMAGIRGKNTKIEVLVRKALFAKGFRYRLHQKHLPGRPDLVMPGRKIAVFVHGCYWHGHDCGLFRLPKSNSEFWKEKINANSARDFRNVSALVSAGWRVAIVWECALRGKGDAAHSDVADRLSSWIEESQRRKIEIRG